MNKISMRVISTLLILGLVLGNANIMMGSVNANTEYSLPYGFTSVSIGENNNILGNAFLDELTKQFIVEGYGITIGKDQGAVDNYHFVSYEVEGNTTIIGKLTDFDMSNAKYGQAGLVIRDDNKTDNSDYFGVYVEPSKGQYRYAYRDNATGGTGAAKLSGITSEDKGLYIKLEKLGSNCKYYLSYDKNFETLITSGGQTLIGGDETWNVGFFVSSGGSSQPATAIYEDVIIKDSNGIVYESNPDDEPEQEEPDNSDDREVFLPKGFINSIIGSNSEPSYVNFDTANKFFTIEGSGTYIGKDIGTTDEYTFINYEVNGDATITARLIDFDMSKAKYGQAGIFIRDNNTTNNADYFGVYVEPSKNQYRYAYRDNLIGKSGAAAISGLTASSKNLYIKIVKASTTFTYYISEDKSFSKEKTITGSQVVSNMDTAWNVGFVVSNGGSEGPAIATFDNIRIETVDKVYYDSNLEERPVDTVENLQAVSGDSSVELTWNPVEKAQNYVIKRSVRNKDNFIEIDTIDASETTFIDEDVINFETYYYIIVAKNEDGVSHDSQAVMAIPNNSNPYNLQYGDDAATFTMTEEPNDTVYNAIVKIAGFTNKDGIITIRQNNEIILKNLKKLANEVFEYDFKLKPGRNTIEIYQTTDDNKTTKKAYNIVYTSNSMFDIIVDSNYTGIQGQEVEGIKTYSTVQEAINSVSSKNKERVVIFIKNGIYKEKLTIGALYISLIGEDSDKTILTYDAANGTINPETGEKYGTSKSASVTIKKAAVGFTAENLTIENSFKELGKENEQAVALNNQADKSIFVNCRFIGNQDTLLADASSSSPARQYYYKCYIEGDVDFIFGRAQAVFNDCDIASYNRNTPPTNGYITAADTWDSNEYGYLIMNSRLIGLDNIADNSVSLGRPWRPSSITDRIVTPAVAYLNCYMGSHITSKGWDDMSADSLASTSRFYEFGSYGPGAKLSDTRNRLTIEEVSKYTMKNVYSSGYESEWNPMSDLDDVNINSAYVNLVEVDSIKLDKIDLVLSLGDMELITAEVGPSNAIDKTVIFKSSDETIVTVDKDGNLKAVGIGTAKIIAESGNVQAECYVTVFPRLTFINRFPKIFAEDVVIKVGDIFEAKQYATANDYEDGDLTSKIEVIVNTVNKEVAGEYKVVYRVSDSKGASTTKQINVRVLLDEEDLPNTDIPDDDKVDSVKPDESLPNTDLPNKDDVDIFEPDENLPNTELPNKDKVDTVKPEENVPNTESSDKDSIDVGESEENLLNTGVSNGDTIDSSTELIDEDTQGTNTELSDEDTLNVDELEENLSNSNDEDKMDISELESDVSNDGEDKSWLTIGVFGLIVLFILAISSAVTYIIIRKNKKKDNNYRSNK